ncbi:TetR/AcrR family transcriptional regulator [Paenibacillus sp. FSL R5-0766]|uniref:TetR/AcrR family transcriptional regulator n=1 Tax=unclassified Paenibacillus TaxID=185978 RepID=UPI00096FBF0B|nr:TetR/AcrR family transcriptional regulator [Paenibacillus sp. FSL R5-0765]OMF61298.1 TetR family transcriptional regulator [Paenibacillus sp. FSL R5-0765]
MGKDKVDLRILKTRKAIKEAFLRLVQTKGYERITVQDIAEEAMINRNTFYLHYVDKPQFMEKLFQENVESLNACLSLEVSSIHEMDKDMFATMLTTIFDNIEANMIFFKTMITQNIYPNFSVYLKEAFKTIIFSGIGDYRHDEKIKIGLEYMISGLVGVICLWIVEPENYRVDNFIEQLSEIHYSNMVELLKDT